MNRRLRARLQRYAWRATQLHREVAEIRHGDPLAQMFARFGPGSRIEAPQILLNNPASVSIGDDTYIRAHVCIEAIASPDRVVLTIGSRVQIGYYVRFVALNGIEVADDAGVGHGSTVTDTVHEYKSQEEGGGWQAPLKVGRPLRIGRGAWIGNNNVVTGGITIGDGAITVPNSVINRSVPAGTIVGGNPARVLRRRRPDGEWEWLIDPATLDLETQAAIDSTS
jgi:acetyltransferase-like isoleucine patch superfamily enzyme